MTVEEAKNIIEDFNRKMQDGSWIYASKEDIDRLEEALKFLGYYYLNLRELEPIHFQKLINITTRI